ncbi:MAG: flagellar biosynthesis repressor FlbT [Neomegalonema sp.]|nr:flagellar biosynthesis repressor FlbT [Neomegalonema sp.]
MAGLVLKLAPQERVLVNGVVMENGDRKTTLKVKTPNASILRLRDALHPDDATTPVTRAYYAAQLAVAGSNDAEQTSQELRPQLAALALAFETLPEQFAQVSAAQEALRNRNFYAVMRSIHPLIAVERELLDQGRGAPAAMATPSEPPTESLGGA